MVYSALSEGKREYIQDCVHCSLKWGFSVGHCMYRLNDSLIYHTDTYELAKSKVRVSQLVSENSILLGRKP